MSASRYLFPEMPDNTTQMTLGSNLELLDVASGKRDVIYTVPYSIQAPNWLPQWQEPDL